MLELGVVYGMCYRVCFAHVWKEDFFVCMEYVQVIYNKQFYYIANRVHGSYRLLYAENKGKSTIIFLVVGVFY